MCQDPYMVKVQDYGEVYEYGCTTLKEAEYLMSVERLPCSIWTRDSATGVYIPQSGTCTQCY